MSNVLDIDIKQHATFFATLQINDAGNVPIDVSGWEFSGSIKHAYKDTDPIATFIFLTGSAASGSVNVFLTSTESGKLIKTTYLYDWIGIDPNTTPIPVYRLSEGTVNVDLGVTDPVAP